MIFSIDSQRQASQYKAPDPMFITIVLAVSQGFPWERFERFFESRPLIKASAADQVFLMRILALQEILCLDDEAVLSWVKNQMYLFAFIDSAYKPKMPNAVVLKSFREKLSAVNILQPFRMRCQDMVLKYGALPDLKSPVGEMSGTDSLEAYLSSSELDDTATFPVLNTMDLEERWVTCPVCDSAALNHFVPQHLRSSVSEPWASCQKCNHKFKVG